MATQTQQALIAKNWRDLIRPRMLEVEDRSDTYGKFVCEPLERGFGITLGNSIRRVLLSSLQGAAITAVALEGVLHEFAFVPGIVEDVTDIVLNFKGVLLRTSSTETIHGRISKKGEPGPKKNPMHTLKVYIRTTDGLRQVFKLRACHAGFSRRRYRHQGAVAADLMPYLRAASPTTDAGSAPARARTASALMTTWKRSTSKNERNAARVSLRPKPSVPSVT